MLEPYSLRMWLSHFHVLNCLQIQQQMDPALDTSSSVSDEELDRVEEEHVPVFMGSCFIQ